MRARLLLRQALQRFAVAAALASAVACGAALADERGRPIQDPHYGDTLFHFYQDHYFTAVTNLMVSQHFDRVPQHRDEAEVLRGGMLLSYGLHREAGEIFAQLIEKGAAPAVRDRAWFYLAKIRYQRGCMPQAEEALARIGDRLPPALEEERGLLHAQLLMARADYAARREGAERDDRAAAMPGSTLATTSASRSSATATARRAATGSTRWARASVANEELRGLRDKANVALGFAALQDERPDAARTYLERVRLSGLHANKALLGFGWAAAALEAAEAGARAVDRARAARARATRRCSRRASRCRMRTPSSAPSARRSTATTKRSTCSSARARASTNRSPRSVPASWSTALIDRNPGDEMGWFWNIRELPEMPHGRHLAQVLAQHEFQEAFKNYRDLRFLGHNLQRWQDNLGVFGDMLANRRQAYASDCRRCAPAQVQRERARAPAEAPRRRSPPNWLAPKRRPTASRSPTRGSASCLRAWPACRRR